MPEVVAQSKCCSPNLVGSQGLPTPEIVAERCYVVLTITQLDRGPACSWVLLKGPSRRNVSRHVVLTWKPPGQRVLLLEVPCLCSLEPPSPSPCHSGASHPAEGLGGTRGHSTRGGRVLGSYPQTATS